MSNRHDKARKALAHVATIPDGNSPNGVVCTNYEKGQAIAALVEYQDAQIKALVNALKEAGDVIEAYYVNTGVDLGVASRMPFYSDTIDTIDAALSTVADLT